MSRLHHPQTYRSLYRIWFLLALLCLAPTLYADVIINDVTQLNPITMQAAIAPTSNDEVVQAVRDHNGPISIGGGRYSMGGQTAIDHGLQIDMRQMNKVIAFSAADKEITVQAGITWRAIQEYIDPYNLAVRIMQTYDNFTVGGSLSVNVHGRYIGQGPLVLSVKSLRIVLADGQLVTASPSENREIFYGAIGGYGGLGVIVEATLMLADNVKVERQSKVMPIGEYATWFSREVESNPDVIFHNADIYPNAYDTVRATSWVRTDKPVTEPDRLIPLDKGYLKNRLAFKVISGWPFGKGIRQHLLDPMLYAGDKVEFRNYEASYRVEELEPSSRKSSTYVLQEYFVPAVNLTPFVDDLRTVLRRHHVNVINISIRHARRDPGTLLAWARQDVFAFVLYYKQGTSEEDRKMVGAWTRELIDRVIAQNGSYYLPYQLHATVDQFHAAYPDADRYFALKRQLDPTGKFRNKLWEAYDHLPVTAATPAPDSDPLADTVKAQARQIPGYVRDEGQTYLTLPEWFLVYNPDEYAQYLKQHGGAGFPYFGSIGQGWGNYRDVTRITRRRGYPTNWGYHLMVSVLCTSYTVELGVKGLYENSAGRLTEWTAGGRRTPEDDFSARVAQEYVDFIRVDPWYEFSFSDRLKQLWTTPDPDGRHRIRRWERKGYLTTGYLVKAGYGGVIKVATKAIYGDADAEMMVLSKPHVAGTYPPSPKVRVLREYADGSQLLLLPRYEEFREHIAMLARAGVGFREIAGNERILMTLVVPDGWTYPGEGVHPLFARPVLTQPGWQRVALDIDVPRLDEVVRTLDKTRTPIEHLYDF
ncbi:MAG: FAD-binding oxidoreductase [Fluviicoccus sp.]|uniref:FAD-dependent oxidoreductase n=1 Tax=Fluviicoccus sp. TaxID=2003552 RepID=UPI0027254EC5|nr:FAD-binding oxidoreductase [Fluviicoccus sp.]MDO8332222.1 FAD-binding oxidoreductase [Fluviicoccus sp.]